MTCRFPRSGRLARNRLIHALANGRMPRSRACRPAGHGAAAPIICTASGRPLFVFDDGSEAARALLADVASPIGLPKTLFAQPEPQLRLDL